MEKQKGFTLLEVIVGIAIIAVIGVFSSTLLTRTYNSSEQTETISKLRQNGQTALNTLTETIRMSDGVVCTGSYGASDGRQNYIVIREKSGIFTKFRFVEPVMSSGQVTTNGYLVKQENLDPLQIKTFCSTNPVTSSEIALTNAQGSTGISVSGGVFNRIPGNEGKDTVNILFYVSPSLKVYNSSTDATMQTTVKVR